MSEVVLRLMILASNLTALTFGRPLFGLIVAEHPKPSILTLALRLASSLSARSDPSNPFTDTPERVLSGSDESNVMLASESSKGLDLR